MVRTLNSIFLIKDFNIPLTLLTNSDKMSSSFSRLAHRFGIIFDSIHNGDKDRFGPFQCVISGPHFQLYQHHQ
jgi:hypothetical protein